MARPDPHAAKTVIIVLASLVSEGTPHMALAMCAHWLTQGVRPVLLVLDAADDEMRPEFAALGIEIVAAHLRDSGYVRFLGLIGAVRALVRRTGASGVVSMLFGCTRSSRSARNRQGRRSSPISATIRGDLRRRVSPS